MSELERKAVQRNVFKLPQLSSGSAVGVASRSMDSIKGQKQTFSARGKRDFTPVAWSQYFEHVSDVKVADDTFRVYESGKSGPICFFLHGGGFSALSWAVLCKVLTGLVTCRCAAMDFRGHGDTHTSDDENLDAQIMANDVGNIVNKMYGNDSGPIILIGHSMGGAIATHVASMNIIPSLVGLIVIDVVEGTALEALSSMQSFLKSRPSTFTSIDRAIEYCVKSGQIRNLESAKVSVVGQIKKNNINETATSLPSHEQQSVESHYEAAVSEILYEESNENEEKNSSLGSKDPNLAKQNSPFTNSKSPTHAVGNQYSWRIDLPKTEKYWKGWFQGLSKMFLTCNVAKLLLLAGVDRLDKDLTVGQMQGKFQMQVLPQCGHAVHEDSPDKVAELIASFLARNRFIQSTQGFQKPAFPVPVA